MGTDWNNTKDGTLKKKKKNLAENLIAFYVFKKGLGVGGGKERKLQSRVSWGFFFFFGLFKDYYVLDTVNHLYTHIQEVNLQNSMRGLFCI